MAGPPSARILLFTDGVELIEDRDRGSVLVRVRVNGNVLVEASVEAKQLLEAALELLPQLEDLEPRRLLEAVYQLLEPRLKAAIEAWKTEAKVAKAAAQAIDAGNLEEAARIAEDYPGTRRIVRQVSKRIMSVESAIKQLMERAETLEVRAAALERLLKCIEEAIKQFERR